MNIKVIFITLLLNVILFAALLFGTGHDFFTQYKTWFLFAKTSSRNLNQQNYVNYNYPYNMLLSTEPNAIFMTEGGDNQVFSILYFALVEKRRPDVDFFDQKGNVFPRLYGDFFKSDGADVAMIRELRDFQLYSTGRPVYLTWRRPNVDQLSIENLQALKKQVLGRLPVNQQAAFNAKYKLATVKQIRRTTHRMVQPSIYDMTLRSGGKLGEQDYQYLGPWYLKPLGLLYRVTPLRYAIVDVLETRDAPTSLFVLRQHLGEFTRLNIDDALFRRMIAVLVAEKYITETAETLSMLRPFHPLGNLPDEDYWQQYTIVYNNVANAPYWERLARNIYVVYAELQRDMYARLERTYRMRSETQGGGLPLVGGTTGTGEQFLQNNFLQNNFSQKAKDARDAQVKVILETAPYVYDNNSYMYNVANLLREQQKPLEAVDYYERAAHNFYPLTEPAYQAARLLIAEAYEHWDAHEGLLARASSNIEQALANRRLHFQLKEPNKDHARDPVILTGKRLNQQVQLLKQLSPKQLAEQKTAALAKRSRRDLRTVAQRYLQLDKPNEAIRLYEEVLRLEPAQTHWYLDFISLIGPSDARKGLALITRLEENYAELDNPPKLWEFEYTRGQLLFRQNLERYRTGTPLSNLSNKLIESSERLTRYIEAASPAQSNNNVRKRIIIAEKTINYISNLTRSLEQP